MSNLSAPEVNAQPISASNPEESNFHQLFPQLPIKEKLVQSCKCGLIRRKLVRMGRMYVTPLRMCFSSSFMEEPLIIALEDVLSLERKSNFVCDTIVIITKAREEYYFTAFLSTGVTQMLNLLKTLWSVREKYAADRDTCPPEGDESDDASSGFSRSASIGSSASRAKLTTQKDTDSQADARSQSMSAQFKPNERRDSDLSASSQTASRRRASPPPKDRASQSGVSPERQSTPETKKTSVQDATEDARPKTLPEFRRFFPSIPATESVIDSFTCCYQFGASRLGKMWITQNYILFVSPMMDSKLEINFNDVSSIEKEQKLVLLDGFCVRLKNGDSRSFSNFPSRDAALKAVESTFQGAKNVQKESSTSVTLDGPLIFKTSTCVNDESKIPVVDSLDAFSQVDTEFGTSLSAVSCFEKEIITPVKLPTGKSVLHVFGLCFDDGSTLLEQYHTERKDTDQKWEPWRPSKDGGAFRGQRQFTCTTLVKAMMGRPYTYIEYQRYALLKVGDAPTLAVQFSSQVPGVMFGDAFRVEALVVFTQAGSGASAEVTMRVRGHVQFLKSVWVKGRILSTTLNVELPEGYSALATLITGRLKNHHGGGEGTAVLDAASAAPEENGVSEASGQVAGKPYTPMLYSVWPFQGFAVNITILSLASLCFVVSFSSCLVMAFSPIGAFKRRGVLQAITSPLTAVITSITTFVSCQIGLTALVSL